jgi:hypothetical protein
MIILNKIRISKIPPGNKEMFHQELENNIGNYIVLSREPRHIPYNTPVIKKKILEVAGDIIKLQWVVTEEYHIGDLLEIKRGFVKKQERGNKSITEINLPGE